MNHIPSLSAGLLDGISADHQHHSHLGSLPPGPLPQPLSQIAEPGTQGPAALIFRYIKVIFIYIES